MGEPINIVELPAGFSMRPARLEDLDPCVEVLNICALAQTGQEEMTINELRSEWEMPGVDIDAQIRLVSDEQERIVGYIEVWDNENPPVDMWVWGRVHPDYEGLGIGSVLMGWARQRAAQAVGRCPPDARVIIRSGALSTYQPTKDLFVDLGMTPVRHFWRMRITYDGTAQPEPIWPEGIELRSYRYPQDLAAVVRADRDAFRDHWGFIERTEAEEIEKWRHWIESDPNFDPDLWFLAMDGDEIAGVCLCNPIDSRAPGYGHILSLGVRRPWRMLGLGAALLHHSFLEMAHKGKIGVTLGVDASSITGATRLYERVGMTVTQQQDIYELELRPGVDLTNVG